MELQMSLSRPIRALLAAGLLLALGLAWWDRQDDQPDPLPSVQTESALAVAPPRTLPIRTSTSEEAQENAVAVELDARIQEELEASNMLLCPIEGDAVLPRRGTLRLGDDSLVAISMGQRVFIRGVPSTGEGLLQYDGMPPLPVSWEDRVCAPIVVPLDAQPMRLNVSVDDPFESERVFVTGCGLWRPLEPGEVVSTWVMPDEICVVQAWRMDGALRALALPEPIVGEPGEVLDLEMMLPDFPMAGMGISFRMDDVAVRVMGVMEDTPAWDAGLREGDLILRVDEESTEGMDDYEFIVFGTGPAGSRVELEVKGKDGEVGVLSLLRAPLDDGAPPQPHP
jgi:hypothetical protein